MQLFFVTAEALTAEQLLALAGSWKDAPEFQKVTKEEFAAECIAGNHLVFEAREGEELKGTLAVSIRESNGERRLSIDAFSVKGAMRYRLWWQAVMDRLARDFQCTKIETTVFSPRVAKMHQLLGHKIESITLTRDVGYEQ